ncbi:hypothetical protein AGMMS49975_00740 [Clostridia bacterium]|nr:hypothetical protein AGMMS49975_00740 [Clostridia bacterium]
MDLLRFCLSRFTFLNSLDYKRYPESAKYAQNELNGFYRRMDEYHGNRPKNYGLTTPVLFFELDEKQKTETFTRLEELIDESFCGADYLLDDEDRDGILEELCAEVSDSLNSGEPEPYDPFEEYDDCDDELLKAFNAIVERFAAELRADGIELPHIFRLADSSGDRTADRAGLRHRSRPRLC